MAARFRLFGLFRLLLVFSCGVVDLGEGGFGVSDGPLGVVEGRIGRSEIMGDAEPPIAIEGERGAQFGGVVLDWFAVGRDFAFRRVDSGMKEGKRPVLVIIVGRGG